jgi:hypothetical protein
MKTSTKLSLMASLISMSQMTTEHEYNRYGKPKHYRKSGGQIDGDTRLSEDKKKQMQGLKEFIYGNTSVWAINKKNADKKAKKLNLL